MPAQLEQDPARIAAAQQAQQQQATASAGKLTSQSQGGILPPVSSSPSSPYTTTPTPVSQPTPTPSTPLYAPTGPSPYTTTPITPTPTPPAPTTPLYAPTGPSPYTTTPTESPAPTVPSPISAKLYQPTGPSPYTTQPIIPPTQPTDITNNVMVPPNPPPPPKSKSIFGTIVSDVETLGVDLEKAFPKPKIQKNVFGMNVASKPVMTPTKEIVAASIASVALPFVAPELGITGLTTKSVLIGEGVMVGVNQGFQFYSAGFSPSTYAKNFAANPVGEAVSISTSAAEGGAFAIASAGVFAGIGRAGQALGLALPKGVAGTATSIFGRAAVNAGISGGANAAISGGNVQATEEGLAFGAAFSFATEPISALAARVPVPHIGSVDIPYTYTMEGDVVPKPLISESPITKFSVPQEAKEFADFYGIKTAKVNIRDTIEPGGNLDTFGSYYSGSSNHVSLSQEDATSNLANVQHELGHAAHFELSSTPEGLATLNEMGIKPYGASTQAENEVSAWMLAGAKAADYGQLNSDFITATKQSLTSYDVRNPQQVASGLAKDANLMEYVHLVRDAKFDEALQMVDEARNSVGAKAFLEGAGVHAAQIQPESTEQVFEGKATWRGLYYTKGNVADTLVGKWENLPGEGVRISQFTKAEAGTVQPSDQEAAAGVMRYRPQTAIEAELTRDVMRNIGVPEETINISKEAVDVVTIAKSVKTPKLFEDMLPEATKTSDVSEVSSVKNYIIQNKDVVEKVFGKFSAIPQENPEFTYTTTDANGKVVSSARVTSDIDIQLKSGVTKEQALAFAQGIKDLYPAEAGATLEPGKTLIETIPVEARGTVGAKVAHAIDIHSDFDVEMNPGQEGQATNQPKTWGVKISETPREIEKIPVAKLTEQVAGKMQSILDINEENNFAPVSYRAKDIVDFPADAKTLLEQVKNPIARTRGMSELQDIANYYGLGDVKNLPTNPIQEFIVTPPAETEIPVNFQRIGYTNAFVSPRSPSTLNGYIRPNYGGTYRTTTRPIYGSGYKAPSFSPSRSSPYSPKLTTSMRSIVTPSSSSGKPSRNPYYRTPPSKIKLPTSQMRIPTSQVPKPKSSPKTSIPKPSTSKPSPASSYPPPSTPPPNYPPIPYSESSKKSNSNKPNLPGFKMETGGQSPLIFQLSGLNSRKRFYPILTASEILGDVQPVSKGNLNSAQKELLNANELVGAKNKRTRQ